MEWINYHHLLYFWTVVREGSLKAAGEKLRLAPSTVSGQIHQLEDVLGQALFDRSGRALELSEFGREVYRYAEEIFTVGQELLSFVQGHATGGPLRLRVGVTMIVPKLIVRRILAPVFELERDVHLFVHEGTVDELVGDLASHHLDVLLTDAPVGLQGSVRTFNHLLFESPIGLFGTSELADAYGPGFPDSLEGAPMLLPTTDVVTRREIDQWFASIGVYPRVLIESQDAAQTKAFGEAGLGLFPAPAVIAAEIERRYGPRMVGPAGPVVERFYAVSVERKFKHPAVVALYEHARNDE